MRLRRDVTGAAAGVLAAGVILLTAPAGAQSEASVRFVHAAPGVGSAELTAGDTSVGEAGFGEATERVSVGSGDVDLTVSADGDEAGLPESLDAGASYTVAALLDEGELALRAYRDGTAKGGAARVRALNGAPELGPADVRVGDRTVGESVSYGEATDYVSIDPGNYEAVAEEPGDGEPIVRQADVALTAGTTVTTLIAGSRGEPVQIVALEDATEAPGTAPDTGLGGLADGGGPVWALVMLAALVAGALGGMGYRFATSAKRSGPGSSHR